MDIVSLYRSQIGLFAPVAARKSSEGRKRVHRKRQCKNPRPSKCCKRKRYLRKTRRAEKCIAGDQSSEILSHLPLDKPKSLFPRYILLYLLVFVSINFVAERYGNCPITISSKENWTPKYDRYDGNFNTFNCGKCDVGYINSCSLYPVDEKENVALTERYFKDDENLHMVNASLPKNFSSFRAEWDEMKNVVLTETDFKDDEHLHMVNTSLSKNFNSFRAEWDDSNRLHNTLHNDTTVQRGNECKSYQIRKNANQVQVNRCGRCLDNNLPNNSFAASGSFRLNGFSSRKKTNIGMICRHFGGIGVNFKGLESFGNWTSSYLLGNSGMHCYNGNPPGRNIKDPKDLERSMILKLSEHLTPNNKKWKIFKFMTEKYLNEDESTACKDIFDVYKELDVKEVISIGCYDVLISICDEIGLKKASGIVQDFTTKIKKAKKRFEEEEMDLGEINSHLERSGKRRSIWENEQYDLIPDKKIKLQDEEASISTSVEEKPNVRSKRRCGSPTDACSSWDEENSTLTAKLRKLEKDMEDLKTRALQCRIENKPPTDAMNEFVKQWEVNEKTFVETRASEAVITAITNSNVVTIVGSPGSGKSYCMYHAALKLKEKEYIIYPISECQDIDKFFVSGSKQLFIIDDPIGEFQLDKKSLSDWKSSNEKISVCIRQTTTKLMLTIRRELINQLDSFMSDLVVNKNCIDLNSEELSFTNEEREKYIIEFAQKKGTVEIDDDVKCLATSCKLDFFPLLCHLYCSNQDFRSTPKDFFSEPYCFLETHFNQMWSNTPSQFYALVICAIYDGQLPMEYFESFRNDESKEIIKKQIRECDESLTLNEVRKQLDNLQGVFLYKSKHSYSFIHSTFKDIVSYVFGKKYNAFVLDYCGINYLIERCTLSREVVNVHIELEESVQQVAQHVSNKLSDKIPNNVSESKFRIQISENLEPKLASKFIDAFIVKDKDGSLSQFFMSTLFRSVYFSDARFLETFFTLFEKNNDIMKGLRDQLQYELLTCACLARNEELIQLLYDKNASYVVSDTNDRTMISLPSACAYTGNMSLLEKLIKDHSVNLGGCGYGTTPLGFSVLREEIDMTKYLITHGADINLGDPPPLTIAVVCKRKEIVNLLLTSDGIDINKCDKFGCTPFTYSVLDNSKDITYLLLECHADVNAYCEGFSPYTPLCAACRNGDIEMINLLLRHKADIDLCNGKNSFDNDLCGSLPICIASSKGQKQLVQLLLKHGADINNCDGNGTTALTYSVSGNHTELMKFLLHQGADVNLYAEGSDPRTPLCYACAKGTIPIVEELLLYNADVNKYDGYGNTPLTYSVINKHIDLCKLLLQHAADVNMCGDTAHGAYEISPLYSAASWDILKIMEIFNDLAVVNLSGDTNRGAFATTPLCSACSGGSTEILELLLHHKVDVNKCDEYGNTPLQYSVGGNHTEIARRLISRGADVNLGITKFNSDILLQKHSDKSDNLSYTPLCSVCYYGNMEMVKLLLENGADINKYDRYGNTPLAYSVLNNHSKITKLLMKNKADINLCGNCGHAYTPLTAACHNGDIEIVTCLLKHGADVNKFDGRGHTPLTSSIFENHYIITDHLIKHGVIVNLPVRLSMYKISNFNDNNFADHLKTFFLTLEPFMDVSPLSLACQKKSYNNVKLLISNNCDVNKYDKLGNTPLTCSIQNKQTAISELLIQSNADINLCGEGFRLQTPLGIACKNSDIEAVKLLLGHEADINKYDRTGCTPLALSVVGNNQDISNFLLNHKVDVNLCRAGFNAPIAEGQTPLTSACEKGWLKLVKILLKRQANVNNYDERGLTPLVCSILGKCKEITQLLINYKADVNLSIIKDNQHRDRRCEKHMTPLSLACRLGLIDIVKILLDNDTDVNRYDTNGNTPLTYSAEGDHTEISQFLLDHKADVNLRGVDNMAMTPLCLAIIKGHKHSIEQLLSHKADINKSTGCGDTPLALSIATNNIEIIKKILLSSDNIGSNKERAVFTKLLRVARKRGWMDIIKHLQELHLDVNKQVEDSHNMIPISLACKRGLKDMVKILITQGVNINEYDVNGNTPLMYSVSGNYFNITNLLLQKKADVNLPSKNNNAMTPLCSACIKGNIEIVKLLLQHGANVNDYNSQGNTPLTLSVEYNRSVITTLLLKQNADINLSGKSNSASTPLCFACKKGKIKTVELLLEHQADVNTCDARGLSPLIHSIVNNHKEITVLLINKKANVNISKTAEGNLTSAKYLEYNVWTPLAAACQKELIDIIKLLLNHNANVNQCDGYGNTPLTYSIRGRLTEITKLLLEENADVNLRGTHKKAETPLCIACRYGSYPTVELLLKHNADTNKPDGRGCTPLIYCILEKRKNIAKLLMENGADVNMCRSFQIENTSLMSKYKSKFFLNMLGDKQEITPLCCSCDIGHTDIVKLLLGSNIEVNKYDREGNTALLHSIRSCHTEISRLLLNKGADVNVCGEGEEAMTPLCYSSKHGHLQNVEFLLNYKASVNRLDGCGNSPLTYSSAGNFTKIIELLLSSKANVNLCGENTKASTPLCSACKKGYKDTFQLLTAVDVDINKYDGRGNTPITYSVAENHIEIVNDLLCREADIDLCGEGEDAMTPLTAAINNGHTHLTKLLLDRGAAVNKCDGLGNTPLTNSVIHSNVEMSKLLFSHGADKELCGSGKFAMKPLIAAIKNESFGLIKLLLDNKASINKCDGTRNTPLIHSVLYKNVDISELLLSRGADVDLCGEDAMTPLSAAINSECIPMIQLLLRYKASVNIYDETGNTPLINSVKDNKLKISQLLLRHGANVDLCSKGKNVMTPLSAAIKHGYFSMVKLLLHYKASINKCDGTGNTPLTHSITCKNVDISKLLLDEGADVDMCGNGKDAMAPLCVAVDIGHAHMINLLLRDNASINKCNREGNTPLTHSINRKNVNISELLLFNGANIDLCGDGEDALTPLCAAVKIGHTRMIKLLLSYKASINKFDGTGNTPLKHSVIHGNLEISKFLIHHRADVDLCGESEDAMTPLCAAVNIGHTRMIELLLHHKASINKLDGSGNTPLTCSVFRGNVEISKFLIGDHTADVDLCGEGEYATTPLCAAVITGHTRMIELLLHHKASVNKCDGAGNSPLTNSVLLGNVEISNLLFRHGADVDSCGEGEDAMTSLFAAGKHGIVLYDRTTLNS